MGQVLTIFLDGYDHALGERMQRDGDMPAMARLAQGSARYRLEHGAARRTGLAGEHVATGRSPKAAGRWAAVHFDPSTYAAWQEGTSATPFPASLDARTVVVDAPYFDLARTPETRGIVGWGAHDPGVDPAARPPGLLDEVHARFGRYAGAEHLYRKPWRSPEQCAETGRRLTEAVTQRASMTEWLLRERLPDWDLALVAVSEAHSAIEALWHGVDPAHPLHDVASSAAAAAGVHAVYREIDRLVGALADRFADTALVVFALHGMGVNGSDISAMLLLPELLYRYQFGQPLFRTPDPGVDARLPRWQDWVAAGFPASARPPLGHEPFARRVLGQLRRAWSAPEARGRNPLTFIPAAWYATHWPEMAVFALPSFYDGRVRVNLVGREQHGCVAPEDYGRTVDQLERVLREVVDVRTGEPVVDSVERPGPERDPRLLGPTEADLIVVWAGAPTGFRHPRLGIIGPAPFNRTGGHTGGDGFAYLRAAGVTPGDRGRASAFDVVPTLVELLGEVVPASLSGTSLLATR